MVQQWAFCAIDLARIVAWPTATVLCVYFASKAVRK